MAAGGVSTPATQDAAWVTSGEHPWQRANREVRDGDLVAFAAGALAGGYVAEVGRTWPAGDSVGAQARELYGRSNALRDNMLAACRPGASTRDLLAAYEAAGEPLPPMPIAHGLGLGFDPPVVSEALWAAGEHDRLEPGMVLAVTGYVWQHGIGAVLRRDTVHITDGGVDVLTTSPSWSDC
jgi:Xaa-Pro aminopeptidase